MLKWEGACRVTLVVTTSTSNANICLSLALVLIVFAVSFSVTASPLIQKPVVGIGVGFGVGVGTEWTGWEGAMKDQTTFHQNTFHPKSAASRVLLICRLDFDFR